MVCRSCCRSSAVTVSCFLRYGGLMVTCRGDGVQEELVWRLPLPPPIYAEVSEIICYPDCPFPLTTAILMVLVKDCVDVVRMISCACLEIEGRCHVFDSFRHCWQLRLHPQVVCLGPLWCSNTTLRASFCMVSRIAVTVRRVDLRNLLTSAPRLYMR